MKNLAEFSILLCVLFVFCNCRSVKNGTKNRYVVSPVTDTLVVKLPGYEDELCEVQIYGNNAYFHGTEYVQGARVKFCIRSLPAGRHRVGIRVGKLVIDESFLKR